MEDKDLFSYDNSNNIVNDGESSFDLNSFSTKSEEEKQPPKKEKNRKQKILQIVLTCFLVGLITCSIVVASFLVYAFTMVDGTVDQDLNDLKLNFTTSVYVENKKGDWEEYKRLHGEYNRIWVDYDEDAIEKGDENYKGIPGDLAHAFIAIEDKRFESHYGVDWKRTFAAFINEFFPIKSKFGGSTITQQLVKNLTDDRDQKASRKVREIMRSRYLETKYSKNVILECYLNTIPMGHGTYGVEVAANYYFSKNVHELTLAECACLAAITKAPSYYAPDTNPENNESRRKDVLYQMLDQGYITKEEYEEAKNTEIKIEVNKETVKQDEINSYFIDALIDQVVEDLIEEYGYDKEKAEQLFYTGGYKIYATVDTNIQAIVDKAYLDIASQVKESSNGDPLWGAMTVMDYEGHVKAVAGGIGEKTRNRGFNCATDAVRQPGSTMKPLAVYAPAIEKGLITYSSILNDTKTTYKDWTPKNASGTYLGNVTAQKALERSINTISVALINKLGPQNSYDILTQRLGIKNLTKNDVDLAPLGLGGTNGGLTTLESAAAFAVFGNGGLYYEPTFYTKVTDQKGNIVLEQKNQPVLAFSEDTATVMNKMLQKVIYGPNGTGKAVASAVSNMKLFGKTGTSSENNDKWFVGGSPYYVASSWCGYETMQKMPSANLLIDRKLWSEVMSKIHSGLKARDFEVSDYAVKRYYCTETGLLANDTCPSIDIGWYKEAFVPSACTTHVGVALEEPTTDEMVDETSSDASTTEGTEQSQSTTSESTTSESTTTN